MNTTHSLQSLKKIWQAVPNRKVPAKVTLSREVENKLACMLQGYFADGSKELTEKIGQDIYRSIVGQEGY